MTTTVPCLWFDDQAEQAAELYTSVFPDSRVTAVTRYPAGSPGPEGAVMTVELDLAGQAHTLLNGGPVFSFTEAVSFQIMCADQAEVDHYWDRLTADGGEEGQCGWLKDRFGVSWQVVPSDWLEIATGGDAGRTQRAFTALMGMKKIDLDEIRRAADEVPA